MRGKKPPNVTTYKPDTSPYWYVQWRDGNGRHREPSPYKNKKEADKYAQLLTEKLRRKYYGIERPDETPKALSLGNLAEAYIESAYAEGERASTTRTCQSSRVMAFVDAFGKDVPAESIDADMVDRWKAEKFKSKGRRKETTSSATTVHNILVAARAMYRWAVKRRKLLEIPWDAVTVPTANTHRTDLIVPVTDLQAALKKLDLARPLHRGMLLASFTGLRKTDIETVAWKDWDWKTGVLRWTLSKDRQKKRIKVVLPRAVAAALKEHEGKGLICGKLGDTRKWERAMKRLCGTSYCYKAFRFAFTSGLLEARVDPRYRKALMGRRLDTTEGYEHVDVEVLRTAVESLPWSFGGHSEAVTT